MDHAEHFVNVSSATPHALAALLPAPDIVGSIVADVSGLQPPREHAVPTIDQRTGVFVSGGTVYGPVAYANYGTINTEIRVNTEVGTLINLPPEGISVERLDVIPLAPAPTAVFHDRTDEQASVAALLATHASVWLHGPPGCGLSALLRHVVQLPQNRLPPDGVVFVDGRAAPPSLDDTIQQLFNRFYRANVDIQQHGAEGAPTGLKVALGNAQTYLGQLTALFAFDCLPLGPGDLQRLRDTLPRARIICTSTSHHPDTFVPVVIGSVPSDDARLILAAAAQASLALAADNLADRLCRALECLPLPLWLAGRLLKQGALTIDELVQRLDQLIAGQAGRAEPVLDARSGSPPFRHGRRRHQDEPLTRIARVIVDLLSYEEQAVLAALVRSESPTMGLPMLTYVAGVAELEVLDAGNWLAGLGIVEASAQRYGIPSVSLRHVFDRLLRAGAERSRIAAFLAAAAPARAKDVAWLAAERSNVLSAIKTLLAENKPEQAGMLAQAIQPLLVVRGYWDGWREVAGWALQAAEAAGDRPLNAWALHELGTHAGLVGDRVRSVRDLTEAGQLREALGDMAGAAASEHNLRYLGLRAFPPRLPGSGERSRSKLRRPLVLLSLIALLLGGLGPLIVPPLAGAVRTVTVAPAPPTRVTETAAPPATPTTPPGTSTPSQIPRGSRQLNLRLADTRLSVSETAGTASIRVTLDAPAEHDVRLDVRTIDGTAGSGQDYEAISDTRRVVPGEQQITIVLRVFDDRLHELDETLTVEVSSRDPGVQPPLLAATLTIVDDDPRRPASPTRTATVTPTVTPSPTPTSLAPPTLTSPVDAIVDSTCLTRENVELTWTSVDGVRPVYQWFVEREVVPGKQYSLVDAGKTEQTLVSVPLACGNYRWYVIASAAESHQVLRSKPARFEISEKPG